MTLLVIALNGVFFLGMGIYALARPAAMIRPFGICTLIWLSCRPCTLTGLAPMTLPPVWRSTWRTVTVRGWERKVVLVLGRLLRGPASRSWVLASGGWRGACEDCANTPWALAANITAASSRIFMGVW